MHRNKLSVIIPTFNVGHLISRCLASIANQTYEDIEILVIDGGSTDETVEIIKYYAKKFDFIRFVSESDLGIYDAMNKGLSLASGEWVYFIGADDQLDKEDVIQRVSYHFDSEVDFIYGDIFKVKTEKIEGAGLQGRTEIFVRNICHQAIFYKKDILEVVGKFNLDFKVCADWDINLRYLAIGGKIIHINVVICKYDGRGFSSNTVDHVFMSRKLNEISKIYKKSYWNGLFRICRFDFYDKSIDCIGRYKIMHATYYFILYVYHGILSKLCSSFGRLRTQKLN